MNWMPLKQRFAQCVNNFKYAASKCSKCHKMFEPVDCLEISLINNYLQLKHPF